MAKKIEKQILEKEIYIGGVTLVQKSMFARHLSIMLKSGLPITEALEIVIDSNTGKFKKVIKDVLAAVRSGYSISSSLERYPKVFSKLFINAVRAGEISGTLEDSLENVANQLDKEKEIVSKIKGAMVYPIIILVASFLLGTLMTFFVLPKITPIFTSLKVNLPWSTKLLISFSTFVQESGLIFFGATIFTIIFLFWILRQKFVRPVTHWILLKMPLIGKVNRNTSIVRFTRSLGILLKSGLSIDEALKTTREMVNNQYYSNALTKISASIGKGSRLSEELIQYEKLFPVMGIKMIRVGEESGNLEETLEYLSKFYEIEVDNDIKTLSTFIEPALLLFIGLVVGFLAISIITPIYSITDGLKR